MCVTDRPFVDALLPILEGWNGTFYTSEVAPTFYTYWWNALTLENYAPTMESAATANVPDWSPNQVAWIAAHDPGNSTWFAHGFSVASRVAAQSAIVALSSQLGQGPSGPANVGAWTWGAVHTFTHPSLAGVASFGRNLGPENGDGFTVSVAPFADNLTVPLDEVAIGSSLRLVSAPGPSPSFGILPGGTSGNIASSYYDNQLALWFAHRYTDMALVPNVAGPFPEGVVSSWELQP